MAGQEMKSYLTRGWILRCGYVRDDELAKHPYATSFNYTLSKCPEYASELEELTKKRETLRAKKQTRTAAYDETEKRIKKVREQIRKEERQYVKNARLLGTTISKVTIDSSFDKRRFDVVMFDEVSMAYVPQIITAAALASEKFVCVGDFRQLPPISQSPASKLLQNDIFSYLKIVDAMGEIYWHPWLVMLNEQRRMHPDISKFPNKFIYKNLLKNHPSVEHCHDEIIKSDPLSGEALNLIDLAGSYCAADKNTDGSRFNILSAVVSFSTAVSAEKNEGTSVGIIAPYAAQARLIRAMIRDYYEHGTTTVSCATVHQFQGSESDVLIFDAVESYPKSAVGFLMGKDLNQVSRLINVAITRARGKLITVANARFWENVFKGTNHIFYKLLGHIQNGHRVISQKDKTLQPYIDSINPNRMIRIFTDESEAINALKKDMAKASGIVLVSIPDGELKESAKMILDLLLAAERKGVEILMKSNDYTNLPVTWKRYCWETENAVFPLIVIDDEIVWYGLPTSRMKFKADKTTSYITVMHAMVRIKGKNTVEMIKALTDIEMIEEGINKKQISVKKKSLQVAKKDRSNKQEHSIAISQGLAAFIEKKEVCTECGSHMVLSKNQRGTAYLRCSNRACKHMEYLTPELMNEYISSNHVGCPRHDGGIIKGLLGKYGPCIRCSSGHFMKPEEI
ncbi:MAG: hypothetical protein EOM34_08350 [Clostridia bacterium]|nr:hypothetical protein [Clostridia bacterium]NCD02689.1 hypothetical protein [Clostridia bacterium]